MQLLLICCVIYSAYCTSALLLIFVFGSLLHRSCIDAMSPLWITWMPQFDQFKIGSHSKRVATGSLSTILLCPGNIFYHNGDWSGVSKTWKHLDLDFNPTQFTHCCHMGTWQHGLWPINLKHPVSDRIKRSFVIFDIRALWRSAMSVRVPGSQKLQSTT